MFLVVSEGGKHKHYTTIIQFSWFLTYFVFFNTFLKIVFILEKVFIETMHYNFKVQN